MFRTLVTTISLVAVLLAPASGVAVPQSADDPAMLLRSAMEKEEVDGDLQGAIDLYTRIVASFADRPEVAAKAQLRIGACFEKLGKAEAVKAYQAVLDRFPGQAEAVAEARARLTALSREEPAELTMSRLMASDTYMECQTLSPDGTKLAGITFDAGQDLAVFELASKRLQPLTRYTWSADSRYAYVPVWSPDSTQIAFQAGRFNDSARELRVSDLDGESRVVFEVPSGAVAPCDWLPDKSAIVVVLASEDGALRVGVVSLAEGSFREVRRLERRIDTRSDPPQADAGASADVSPDGRLIAFSDGPPEGKRDIFLVPVAGGTPVALTDHPGDDKEPRWSPDGRRVAFLSDRHGSWALWSVAVAEGKPAGPPSMILEGMQDAQLGTWSKAGLQSRTMIVSSDIYVLKVDPQRHAALGRPHALDVDASVFNLGPSWSPDGKHLSFATTTRTGPTRRTFTSVMTRATGEIRRLEFTSPTRPAGGTGGWLPDGSGLRVIYWDTEKRYYLARLALDGGEWVRQSIPAQGFTRFMSAAWSRDGSAVYYDKHGGDDGTEPGIVEHDLETGAERYVLRAGPGEELSWWIRMSRDSKRLALDAGGALLVVDLGTGQVQRLANKAKQPLFNPGWSPDGRYLVAKGSPDGTSERNELFVVSLADGAIESLGISRYLPPKAGIVTSPDWSPDGGEIAFDTRGFESEANLIRNVLAGR